MGKWGLAVGMGIFQLRGPPEWKGERRGKGTKPPLIPKLTSHSYPIPAPQAHQTAVPQGPLCLYLAGHAAGALPAVLSEVLYRRV